MTDNIRNHIFKIQNRIIPKGYKTAVSGIIPMEWTEYSLNQITDKLTAVSGKGKYETLSISAGVGFVNQADKFGKELSGKQYEKYIILHNGDFSYNKGNSNKYPQGCIYRLKNKTEAAVPNVFESFRFKGGDTGYYEQLFLSGYLNRQLHSKINHGVRDNGLLNLTSKDFYSCTVPYPTLSEQKKIAEILSTQDKVIELLERKIEELKKLKKAYLNKMFPQKGETVPELRFKGFTDAWEQHRLGEIGQTYTGLSGKTKEDFGHGDAKFVTYMNVFSNPVAEKTMTEPIEIDKKQNQVKYGDVFFTTSSETPEEVGMSCVWLENGDNTYLNSFCFGYRPSETIDPFYMAYMFRSENVRKNITFLAQGISRYNISKNKMMEISIPLPSLDEQEQIGSYFRNLDRLITLHQRELDEEKLKKKALMQLLLTGKVRVKI